MDAGANASVLPAFSVASLVGFGAVVAALPAFAVVRDWVLSIEGGPLVSLAVATNVLAALTGSASGGMTIALDALGDTYMRLAAEQGIDPALMHRVAVIGCGHARQPAAQRRRGDAARGLRIDPSRELSRHRHGRRSSARSSRWWRSSCWARRSDRSDGQRMESQLDAPQCAPRVGRREQPASLHCGWCSSASTRLDLPVGALAAAAATWASLRLLPPGPLAPSPVALVRLALRFLCQSVVAGCRCRAARARSATAVAAGLRDLPGRFPPGTARNAFSTLTSLLPGTVPAGDESGQLVYHCLDVDQPVVSQLAAEEAALSRALGDD